MRQQPATKKKGLVVHLIGAGCLGSWLSKYLNGEKSIYQIVVYDPDLVETKNLVNSYYKESNVGQPKVTSLLCRLKKVVGIQERYPTEYVSVKKGDIVIDCSDSPSSFPKVHFKAAILGDSLIIVDKKTLRKNIGESNLLGAFLKFSSSSCVKKNLAKLAARFVMGLIVSKTYAMLTYPIMLNLKPSEANLLASKQIPSDLFFEKKDTISIRYLDKEKDVSCQDISLPIQRILNKYFPELCDDKEGGEQEENGMYFTEILRSKGQTVIHIIPTRMQA
jgi:hypothetical protein